MRIVLSALHYYPDRPSGSVKLAFDEARYLTEMGHQVWIVTQDIARDKPEQCFEHGIGVLRYPSPVMPWFDPRRAQIHQIQTRRLLLRHVQDKPDLVHGHALLQYDGAQQLYGHSVRNCMSVHSPVLMEMQATSRGKGAMAHLRFALASRLTNRIERRCLERSDCITAESAYTKSMLTKIHGRDIADRVRVVPGWVDLERFLIRSDRERIKSALSWPTDVPVLFCLRRLVPRMGLDRLIQAAGRMKRNGYRFSLAIGGRGPLREQLERLVQELDIQDCVFFTGFVPDDVLPDMYAAADAFVLPTMELECFGLIALEALACGRPVLATPVGAIPEVLGRFEKAWLATDNSVDAIARLCEDFLDGRLPSHEPQHLREMVDRYYSRPRVLAQLADTILGTPHS